MGEIEAYQAFFEKPDQNSEEDGIAAKRYFFMIKE